MDDVELIERLRGWAKDIQEGSEAIWAMDQDLKGAADRIEALIAERDAFATANARIEHLEKLDREAATYVESVIAMRTHFTGDPPYVGWKGLGLALNEALDERDAAIARAKKAEAEARYWMRVNDELLTGCENESDIRLAHETDLASAMKGKSHD